MKYHTIDQIKRANANAGYHFFDKDTMRFFKSIAYEEIIGGKYFITSERRDGDIRRYTVHMVNENAGIDTIGGFQAYRTKAQALKAAKQLPVEE